MQIFSLLSAILWLGNVQFDAVTEDTVAARTDKALHNAAHLLGVSDAALGSALSSRNFTAGTLIHSQQDGRQPSPHGFYCISGIERSGGEHLVILMCLIAERGVSGSSSCNVLVVSIKTRSTKSFPTPHLSHDQLIEESGQMSYSLYVPLLQWSHLKVLGASV